MDQNHLLVSISVAIIIIAISIVFYLLYNNDNETVTNNEELFKMSGQDQDLYKPNPNNLGGVSDGSALDKIVNGAEKDITKVKGVTDLYEWGQNHTEVSSGSSYCCCCSSSNSSSTSSTSSTSSSSGI